MERAIYTRLVILFSFLGLSFSQVDAQTILRGKVLDEEQIPLPGAQIRIIDSPDVAITNPDGDFTIHTQMPFPFQVEVIVFYYDTLTVFVQDDQPLLITLNRLTKLKSIVVPGQWKTDRQLKSPRHLAGRSYNEVAHLPTGMHESMAMEAGIDGISSGITLKTLNTRGFNAAVPVRMLQLIDGVDNQSPGLNFPLGNFLGASELDLLRINVNVGASSPLYGPNAFNGAILMETRNPFFSQGLQTTVKTGERQLFEAALRFADVIPNKKGQEWFAYKLNFYGIRANDWEANNYSPITGSTVPINNPGRFDAVNVYGDEYNIDLDVTVDKSHFFNEPGVGNFYRQGYKEADLVDYGTHNYKASAAFHLRLQPEKEDYSPEIVLSTSYGTGSTIYQGDNRFSLRNIKFYQHKLEWREYDRFFLRAYITHEDAGKSYDPYFTALQLVEAGKPLNDFRNDYIAYWKKHFYPRMVELGYPELIFTPEVYFDFVAAEQWLLQYNDSLLAWHALTLPAANVPDVEDPVSTLGYLVPGTKLFQDVFDEITSSYNTSDKGTRFFDRSVLVHIQGEHKFRPVRPWLDEITVGGSIRQYRPYSKGTIFSDTAGAVIRNEEYGLYGGIQKTVGSKKPLTATASMRIDKNENFRIVPTYAAGMVWQPRKQTYVRLSLSSALRNPTLTDQYLDLNVGPATLAGHFQPVDSLITVASFIAYRDDLDISKLVYFDIPALRPEFVRTIEAGISNLFWQRLQLEAGAYYNAYRHFLGYVVGIDSKFNASNYPYDVTVYRYTANSPSEVFTRGATVAMDYLFGRHIKAHINYSYNELVKTNADDQILPAFNTPKHKYNAGITMTDLKGLRLGSFDMSSISMNYRWVQGYEFEGSPQFTGTIDSYGVMDAQWNIQSNALRMMVKIGATNLLNNKHVETYGGPAVGRMGYIQISYNNF